MITGSAYNLGFQIEKIGLCDFSKLTAVSNEDVLKRANSDGQKLIRFIADRMGIENRYFVPEGVDALDLAREALKSLLEQDPKLIDEAEAFIFAGISNPMPTVCHAALLAGEFGFKNVSCWDIKSGCSTGVLGLMQSLDWFQHGARKVVMVCSETFSRFTHPETLQMSASTGDGACALSIIASDEWKVLGAVHGSDPAYLKTMYVPGKYPVNMAEYNPQDYVFHFENKTDTLEKIAYYWQKSLADLLKASKIEGSQVSHYISHQVDGTKNKQMAMSVGIPESAILQNFSRYGNMGCPTIFINYAHQFLQKKGQFKSKDILVLQAVGGGLTWAGVCLQKK